MHKNYPSHVTKEQFENIKSTLENSKKKTKPRNLDLYEVFCAVLYVLKSGCQWRMLPKIFQNDKLYIIISKFEVKTMIKNLVYCN
ncbi:hypothetical protein SHM_24860 [Spiroplasma ixodetis]|uniref:Insertion element IS402-like domain-containing protein n=1 Tax=Spiroplasma ixodetis TaxID=2141 RepID=A0ABM8BTZ0_9MOLU|nr:hypothetical protein SHM_02280 [Spiroplasma ixodetis]BDT03034.1 hypothetical protein SHM_06800 [Spiroplasma ixodetis]BDT03044.1 hypothetical protein SHM_06900 [Spiroplasma ixodetis]BDT03107.1 hypothetical protein SHM_07530 [Spiroplasma ixodetis]BDT03580.1 hypothetical protein SHM_12260 [Spiroplasma ixodetis]